MLREADQSHQSTVILEKKNKQKPYYEFAEFLKVRQSLNFK